MKINIYVKHIVIFLIVITITLSTIFINSIVSTSNSQYSIVFMFSENNISTASPEQIFYNSLKTVQETNESIHIDEGVNNPLLSIDYSRSSSKGDAQAKLELNVDNSDILFIYGNAYNDFLEETIASNSSKIFYLVNNDETFEADNVSTIDFDLSYIYEDAYKDMTTHTETNKLLFVSSTPESKHQYYQDVFVSDENYEITYLYIEDPENNSEISSSVSEYLDLGYDQIFIDDITMNDYAISLVTNYQSLIVEEDKRVEELNEEVDTITKKETENSEDTTTDEIVVSEETEQTETSTEELTDSEIEDIESKLEDSYEQETINLYLMGFDYSDDGIYKDINGEQKTVIRSSYLFDIDEELNMQIYNILEDDYEPSKLKINEENGIIKENYID